jgi:hypothetical protein
VSSRTTAQTWTSRCRISRIQQLLKCVRGRSLFGDNCRGDSRLRLVGRLIPSYLHSSNFQVPDEIRQQPYRREDDERRTNDEKYLHISHRDTSVRHQTTEESNQHIQAITRFSPDLRVGWSLDSGGCVSSREQNRQRTAPLGTIRAPFRTRGRKTRSPCGHRAERVKLGSKPECQSGSADAEFSSPCHSVRPRPHC